MHAVDKLTLDEAPIRSFHERPRFEDGEDADVTAAANGSGSSAYPPGVDATSRQRNRWMIPLIAAACILALLVTSAGGILLWRLFNPAEKEPTIASPTPPQDQDAAEPAGWEKLEGTDAPTGTVDELVSALSDNPLTQATLPVPGSCDLPAIEGLVPENELQPFLDAAGNCLNKVWGDALAAEGLEFEAPSIVVWTPPETPPNSKCKIEETGEAPRSCMVDNALYWPSTFDPGFSNTSGAETQQLYLWHLSFNYAVFAIAAADLDAYYNAALQEAEEDIVTADELRRRYSLQLSCLGSAAVFRLPGDVRPSGYIADFLTSPDAQVEPLDASQPNTQSRSTWIKRGQLSQGSLSACNTWTADESEVE